jgi:hypothetical protein
MKRFRWDRLGLLTAGVLCMPCLLWTIMTGSVLSLLVFGWSVYRLKETEGGHYDE